MLFWGDLFLAILKKGRRVPLFLLFPRCIIVVLYLILLFLALSKGRYVLLAHITIMKRTSLVDFPPRVVSNHVVPSKISRHGLINHFLCLIMPFLDLYILFLNPKDQLLIVIYIEQLRLVEYLNRYKGQLLLYFPSKLADKGMIQYFSSGGSFLGVDLKDPFKQVDDVLITSVHQLLHSFALLDVHILDNIKRRLGL